MNKRLLGLTKRLAEALEVFFKTFRRQRILSEASSLTFVTFMGFIPFFIFILFLITKIALIQEADYLQNQLLRIFLPNSAELIQKYVKQIVERGLSFNIANSILLVVISFFLFRSISLSFDRILNVSEQHYKGIFKNLVRFMTMILFGLILIILLFSASSLPVLSNMVHIPILGLVLNIFLPFILLFALILFVYVFIPAVKIRGKSLFVGAGLSAFGWILAKSYYNWYIENLTNMELVYGVFSTIPVFLFWIYINWVIILGGVVVVSIMEKRHLLERPDTGCKEKIRITIEKTIDRDSISSSKSITGEELKGILRSVLKDEMNDGTDREKRTDSDR